MLIRFGRMASANGKTPLQCHHLDVDASLKAFSFFSDFSYYTNGGTGPPSPSTTHYPTIGV